MRSLLKRLVLVGLAAAAIGACATAPVTEAPGAEPTPSGQSAANPSEPWQVKTSHHVDLWLHGFAMLQSDTTLVPYFRRGYQSEMATLKTRANVTTQLDANTAQLRTRFSQNPQLVNAQFLPLYFASFDTMLQAIDVFLRLEGNPRNAGNQETATTVALLAQYFPLAADQTWVRLFSQSLRDENSRFYRAYWEQQQRERSTAYNAVLNLWQTTYRPRFDSYLTNTSQLTGEIFLSLPLNGEGRTLTMGTRQNAMAVNFPSREADAVEAIYVIAHELVASIVNTAVRDNVTPSDQRAGLADRYIANGAVRGGAILLQKLAPELVDGYARYYLRAANRPVGTNPVTSLATVFPLPDLIRTAIAGQLDVVLSGI